MTDAERLEEIRRYAEDIYPTIRPAVLGTYDEEVSDAAKDETLRRVQSDLLLLLDGEW